MIGKQKFLYSCLSVLAILLILSLAHFVVTKPWLYKHICESKGLIPDEETAKQLADAIIIAHTTNDSGETWFDVINEAGIVIC
jgi:hypothetical protein